VVCWPGLASPAAGRARSPIAALAWGLLLAAAACSSPPPAPPPVPKAPSAWDCPRCNLLLISVDTLRADHLGVYGYHRDTSPGIDALAAHALLFERASSTANRTADSHMSIFTGLYPSAHQVTNTPAGDERGLNALGSGVETLAEDLAAAGWATAGFHDGGHVAAGYGFARGFEVYENTSERYLPLAAKVDRALAWIDEQQGPFFVFFHTYHVHDPYLPTLAYRDAFRSDWGDLVASREEMRKRRGDRRYAKRQKLFWKRVDADDPADVERLEALYDACIREVDAHLARLIGEVLERAPDTLVLLLGDHGEEFGEHGGLKHDQLYQEVLHVPLLVLHPRRTTPRRVAERVSLVDLAPTLLDMLGAPPLAHRTQGRSLVPFLDGREPRASPILSEKLWGSRWGRAPGVRPGRRSLVVGDVKLLADVPSHGRDEIYDLAADPGERRDLSGGLWRRLRLRHRLSGLAEANAELRRLLDAGDGAGPELDDETRRELEALGYL
jgi:arylsulfatase A-like enzyme